MLPSRQPLLIVPIRDRRQSRRILTIRNCAISMLAVAVVIASFSIYRGRRHGEAGQYGGLVGPEVTATDRIRRKAARPRFFSAPARRARGTHAVPGGRRFRSVLLG